MGFEEVNWTELVVTCFKRTLEVLERIFTLFMNLVTVALSPDRFDR